MSTDTISNADANDISKEEILRHIFGEIGELIEDFTCAVESTVLLHGRMYITNKFICFYSNLFGLEKKIRIPYSHIKNITKENTAKIIPNAIAISTDKKDYLFRSFWDREECYRILTAFAKKFGSSSLLLEREGNSKVFSEDGLINADSDYFPPEKDKEKPKEAIVPDVDASVPRQSIRREKGQHVSFNPNEELDTESGLQPEGDDDDESDSPESPVSVDMTLQLEQELQKSRFKIPVISEMILDISLKDFVTLFVQDGASYGINRYHESVKDTNLVLSPWAELSPVLGQGREMKFFKPVNLPGLASTRGVKIQRMKRFEESGLILCSCTKLEDVPAADTFSVDDCLCVKAISASQVQVEVTFQVTFIKSTMMRYIIEKSTNGEMTKWLETFSNHIKKVSGQFKEGKLDLSASSVAGPAAGASAAITAAAGSDPQSSTSTSAALSSTNAVTAAAVGDDGPLPSSVPRAAAQQASWFSRLLRQASDGLNGFNNESLGDRARIIVVLAFALFLLLLHLKWAGATHKLQALEAKVAALEQTVALFLSKMDKIGLDGAVSSCATSLE